MLGRILYLLLGKKMITELKHLYSLVTMPSVNPIPDREKGLTSDSSLL